MYKNTNNNKAMSQKKEIDRERKTHEVNEKKVGAHILRAEPTTQTSMKDLN